jgi:hypothetical protein
VENFAGFDEHERETLRSYLQRIRNNLAGHSAEKTPPREA